MLYVGARSTALSPELDTCYLGSGKALPSNRHDNPASVTKTILKVFKTREELMDYERQYIINNDCIASPNWYNQRKATYDRHGEKPWNMGISTGLNAHVQTFKDRYCNGYRTPAQIDGAKRMREKLTGVPNPAKGKSGTDNNGFKPWYSISPDGEYKEHLDKTKQEFAVELGLTPRQLINRFHYTNEHKVAKTKPLKGWTFGNLPRP
jgi:hypothetical protein